jgi:hypothetical protein
MIPIKVWMALFILGLPIAIFKSLRDPIWAALTACYLYFAIPHREFNMGEYPYAAGFWAIGVLMSAILYRGYFQKEARRQIEEAGLFAVRSAIAAVKDEMREAMILAGLKAPLPGEVRQAGLLVGEEKGMEIVDSLAPVPIAVACRRSVQSIITLVATKVDEDVLRVIANASGSTKGNVRAALDATVAPFVDKLFVELTDTTARDHLARAIDQEQKQTTADLKPRTSSLGPLGIPLPRGGLTAILSNPGLWIHLAFMIVTYIGAQNALYDVNKAMTKFDTEELLLIPMIAIICCVRDVRHLRMYVFAWMLGTAHLCMNAVTYWMHNGGRADDVGGQGGESNFLGAIIVAIAPVALGMVLNEKTRFMRLVGCGFAGVFTLGVLASGSRAALIAFVASAGYWLLYTNKKGIAAGTALLGSSAFLTVAPESFWERMATIMGPKDKNPWVVVNEEESKHERQVLWALAIDIYKDHPMMGIGPGQYNFVSAEQTDFVDAYGGVRGLQTHNMWLQLAAEFGTLGIVVWGGGWLLSFLCYALARHRLRKYPGWEWLRALCLGLEAGAIGSAISCTFNSFQWYDYHYWHFVFGPIVYQIVKETTERIEWMKPLQLQAARPPPRYGPPIADGLDLDNIDLSSAAPARLSVK